MGVFPPEMTHKPFTQIQSTYDRVAEHYARQFFDELSKKPFDRDLLDRFAASVGGRGRVCDLGCGPGHVARYLQGRGVEPCGLDLSMRMVEVARRLNPGTQFEQGDIRALPLPDASLAGIAAFYSIIHLRRTDAPIALREMRRVLAPAGKLVLAFHGGEGEVHVEDWFGQGVAIDATLFKAEEMADYLSGEGFEVEETLERDPYPFEYASRRVYITATKPQADPRRRGAP